MENLGFPKFRVSLLLDNSPISKDYILVVTALLQLVKGYTIVIEKDNFRYQVLYILCNNIDWRQWCRTGQFV